MKLSKNKNDEFSIIESIWVLSCTDLNSVITYDGILIRLKLKDKGYNEASLKKLIGDYGDLFVLGDDIVSDAELNEWKDRILNDKEEIKPAFIRGLKREAIKIKLAELNSEKVFKCRFRAGRNEAPTNKELFSLGIDRIGRLRQAQLDRDDKKIKRRSLILLPFISIFISAAIFIGTSVFQNRSKKDETNLKIEQENYSKFMLNVSNLFKQAKGKNSDSLSIEKDELEAYSYNIDQFLKENQKSEFDTECANFINMCFHYEELNEKNANKNIELANNKRYNDSLSRYKQFFRKKLQPTLLLE